MFARSILVLTLSLGVVAGCTKDEGAKPVATENKTEKAHAPSDVKPGSHEDWCEEHQVPESQCTRCNAELIPAFKATNDWCEEHQMPESQCTKCNPGLVIKRPPKGS
jgi:hypothetical protein